MRVYDMIFNDGETKGVYNISLVENPAMESLYVALKDCQVQLKVVDEERKILLGAVLIPNKLIYRKDEVTGEEYNIRFSKETIDVALTAFQKNNAQNGTTLDHNENLKLNDVTFVENWIKEDEVNDKSVKYGFNEPVGTWFTMMKAHTDEAWQSAKNMKGFSIDGFFNAKLVTLNKNEMDLESIKQAIRDGFASWSKKPEEVKLTLSSVKTADGNTTINFEGDTVAVGLQVSMTSPDGAELPVPDEKYQLEDGSTIVVVNSLIAEIKPADAPVEEVVPTPMAEATTAPVVKSEKTTNEIFYQLSAEIGKNMTELFNGLKAELKEEIQNEIKAVSLTKQKPAKEKSWEQMSSYERYLETKNKN